jgi:hypothetical protein
MGWDSENYGYTNDTDLKYNDSMSAPEADMPLYDMDLGDQSWNQQQPDAASNADFLQNQDWNFGNYNQDTNYGQESQNWGSFPQNTPEDIDSVYKGYGVNPGQGNQNPYLDAFNNALKTGGGALQQMFAPNAKGPNTGNDMMNNIMRLIQGGAGVGRLGLGAYSAQQEKEKAQKMYEYAQQMQQQSAGALDPAAGMRPIARQAWEQTNPIMQQLQNGGITANMQQELNASRMEALRKGGKGGQRFSQYAARQDPYLTAQARKNDFGMQMQALQQRFKEATAAPNSGYTDMLKLPMAAYGQTLASPMTQWANNEMTNLSGSGSSLDGATLDKLRALLNKA